MESFALLRNVKVENSCNMAITMWIQFVVLEEEEEGTKLTSRARLRLAFQQHTCSRFLWFSGEGCLTKHSSSNKKANDYTKIKIDGYIYEIPNFLIYRKIPDNFTNLLIRKSLLFTRQVMLNKFFIPNNLLFPKSRIIFENYFN